MKGISLKLQQDKTKNISRIQQSDCE